jgi:hypothetical protein
MTATREKEVVDSARDLMNDILSQSKDNVALLNRLIAKQDDLLDCSEDMEAVETFFNIKSQQKVIFDTARSLQRDLQNEKDYFVTDIETKEEVRGMIVQCMGDVHTLAGVGMASDLVRKADDRFTEYKNKTTDATSLTLLDAMITQLLNLAKI